MPIINIITNDINIYVYIVVKKYKLDSKELYLLWRESIKFQK